MWKCQCWAVDSDSALFKTRRSNYMQCQKLDSTQLDHIKQRPLIHLYSNLFSLWISGQEAQPGRRHSHVRILTSVVVNWSRRKSRSSSRDSRFREAVPRFFSSSVWASSISYSNITLACYRRRSQIKKPTDQLPPTLELKWY